MTNIDIVTGFLESGKTMLINELLHSSILNEFHEILLLICEEGFTEYDEEKLGERHIKTLLLENESALDDDLFDQIQNQYHPDYIIVEYNGTWSISKILGLKIPFEYKFRNVVFVSEAGSFRNQLENMVTVIQPQILNSDIVVFNRFDQLDDETQKKLSKGIKNINPRTKVIFINEAKTNLLLKERFMTFNNPDNTSLNLKMNLKVGFFLAVCFSLLIILEFPNVYSVC